MWHIPLLCVQWKTPDDGQRNCPKHVEFYSKNKFEKLVHLVGFIIRSSDINKIIFNSMSLISPHGVMQGTINLPALIFVDRKRKQWHTYRFNVYRFKQSVIMEENYSLLPWVKWLMALWQHTVECRRMKTSDTQTGCNFRWKHTHHLVRHTTDGSFTRVRLRVLTFIRDANIRVWIRRAVHRRRRLRNDRTCNIITRFQWLRFPYFLHLQSNYG